MWFSSVTKTDLRRLRRVVRTAERIIGTTLPTLQELYSCRVSKRADKITLDPSHPAHSLFELLPYGRRYRALSTRMTRHRNRFFPHLTLNVEHTTQGSRVRPNFSRVRLTKIPGRTGASSHSRKEKKVSATQKLNKRHSR